MILTSPQPSASQTPSPRRLHLGPLPARRADAHLMHQTFNSPRYDYEGTEIPSLVEELVNRGYDITTLDFSIHMKYAPEI
jgi:hypothetical protein